jgi:hypothetical protein
MKNAAVVLLLLGLGSLAGAQEALVRTASGTVEIKAPGTEVWVPVRAGQKLEKAAVISTGFKSTAVIDLGNSTLTVRPLTRLGLEEIMENQGNERVRLHLQAGRVRADVRPPAGGKTDFTVRSPVATASVRGTSFEFNGTRVSVEEGRVHVSGGDAPGAYAGPGHTVRVNAETGRTATAAETAAESLAPSLPAGADSAPAAPVMPPPEEGTVKGRLEWR